MRQIMHVCIRRIRFGGGIPRSEMLPRQRRPQSAPQSAAPQTPRKSRSLRSAASLPYAPSAPPEHPSTPAAWRTSPATSHNKADQKRHKKKPDRKPPIIPAPRNAGIPKHPQPRQNPVSRRHWSIGSFRIWLKSFVIRSCSVVSSFQSHCPPAIFCNCAKYAARARVKKRNRRRRLIVRIRPRPRRPDVLRPVQCHFLVNPFAHIHPMAVILRRRQNHLVSMYVARVDIDRSLPPPDPTSPARGNCAPATPRLFPKLPRQQRLRHIRFQLALRQMLRIEQAPPNRNSIAAAIPRPISSL